MNHLLPVELDITKAINLGDYKTLVRMGVSGLLPDTKLNDNSKEREYGGD